MDKNYLRQILDQLKTEFDRDFKYIDRNYDIQSQIKSSDISIISGVRRCGKSTLLRQIAESTPTHEVLYIDFESPRLSTFVLSDFELCDEIWREKLAVNPNKPTLLLIDEVQNVLGWERWIRYFSEKRSYKVIITGSNSQLLSSELGSVLGGRYITLEMFPFTAQELADAYIRNEKKAFSSIDSHALLSGIVESGLKYGMFPKPYLEQSTQVYPHLFHDIIMRDIAKRKKIRKLTPLLELGALLARDNTRILNLESTAQLIGLNDDRTVSKYLSYFEEAYLFFRVRRFSKSLRKQLRGHSKCYCIDPILADVVSAQSPRLTSGLENLVQRELRKANARHGFWTSSNGYEVDFVVEDKKGAYLAIQVCYDLSSQNTLVREIRALEAIKEELSIDQLYIVTRDLPQKNLQIFSALGIKVISYVEFLDFKWFQGGINQ